MDKKPEKQTQKKANNLKESLKILEILKHYEERSIVLTTPAQKTAYLKKG